MHLFLTGATGFLGYHTARRLSEKAYRLSGLVRTTSRHNELKPFGFEPLFGDLQHPHPTLSNHLETVDCVIHIAGQIKALHPQEFYQVNVEGTRHLIDAILKCKKMPKRLIHISTLAVHHPSRDGEDFCLDPHQCHPLSHYGKSKCEAEKELERLKGKIQVFTLRPPVLYGPRDFELFPMFKATQNHFAPVYSWGKNRLSVCYIEDVAEAILNLVETSLSSDEIFCLDDGNDYSWKELIQIISQVLQKRAWIAPIPPFLFYPAALITQAFAQLTRRPNIFSINKIKEMAEPRWFCGSQKIQKQLGWKAKIDFKEGAKRTLEYYRNEHLL
ncbi:MAG: NAD(P)-dependent oxidoreductase [Deltaproteobacteria bacterium]|nr:NAD(P)-dependent oxidoreductase [Deltaproteobacteria bacterium]